MEKTANIFNNSFPSDCQQSSVPIDLLNLVSTLIDGVDVENQVFSQSAMTLSQQIMYNFRVKK